MHTNPELKHYVEAEILPRYTHFDKAHQLDHITTVIRQSAALADLLERQGVSVVFIAASTASHLPPIMTSAS